MVASLSTVWGDVCVECWCNLWTHIFWGVFLISVGLWVLSSMKINELSSISTFLYKSFNEKKPSRWIIKKINEKSWVRQINMSIADLRRYEKMLICRDYLFSEIKYMFYHGAITIWCHRAARPPSSPNALGWCRSQSRWSRCSWSPSCRASCRSGSRRACCPGPPSCWLRRCRSPASARTEPGCEEKV